MGTVPRLQRRVDSGSAPIGGRQDGASAPLRRRLDVGRIGERAAAELLQRRGFRVIGTGFVARRGEIDLVCAQGADLVVVEVKARTSTANQADPLNPAEAVNARKRRALTAATAEYRALTQWWGRIRFAVVAVLVDPNGVVLSAELRDDPFE